MMHSIKIPSIIDLRLGENKSIIDDLIANQGKAKDVNQLALTVFCKDDNGMNYEIVQFHNSRHLVHILSGVN